MLYFCRIKIPSFALEGCADRQRRALGHVPLSLFKLSFVHLDSEVAFGPSGPPSEPQSVSAVMMESLCSACVFKAQVFVSPFRL